MEYAQLSGMLERELRVLADDCPNARFHLTYSYRDFSLAALNIVGPQLEVLSFYRSRSHHIFVECAKA